MNKLIYKILHKLSLSFKPSPASLEKYVSIDSTTVILGGLNLRFDAGNEDRKYVQVGKFGMIKADFIFESPKGFIQIGDNVHIGGANLISRERISIGNDVTMAWGITIYDHNSHSIHWEHRQNDNHQTYEDYHEFNGRNVVNKNWEHVAAAAISIEDKVWIGFDVTILKGVTIGEGAVIGAKSVVTRDVPAWTVAAGNPARVVKTLSKT